MITSFRTHTGDYISGQKLTDALNKVADDMISLESAIRVEDAYADHVSNDTKDKIMLDGFAHAERVRKGEVDNFTTWQNINYALTGESVPLLP
jgi:hypothetical protein